MLEVSALTRRFGEHTVSPTCRWTCRRARRSCDRPERGRQVHAAALRRRDDKPDGGRVRWDGRELRETDPAVRAAMAVLLDDAGLFPEMSVAEHLDLLARVHGVADPDAAVDEVLAEVGLTGAADQLPATLSSGQRQRLLLGSCFVRPREVLLLDEPEQRLDVPGRAWLARRLVRRRSPGSACCCPATTRQLAEAVADWVLELCATAGDGRRPPAAVRARRRRVLRGARPRRCCAPRSARPGTCWSARRCSAGSARRPAGGWSTGCRRTGSWRPAATGGLAAGRGRGGAARRGAAGAGGGRAGLGPAGRADLDLAGPVDRAGLLRAAVLAVRGRVAAASGPRSARCCRCRPTRRGRSLAGAAAGALSGSRPASARPPLSSPAPSAQQRPAGGAARAGGGGGPGCSWPARSAGSAVAVAGAGGASAAGGAGRRRCWWPWRSRRRAGRRRRLAGPGRARRRSTAARWPPAARWCWA